MVDVANKRLAEILPISGNDCAAKEIAGINNDSKKFMSCKFFDEFKHHEMLGSEPEVVCGKQNFTYCVSK